MLLILWSLSGLIPGIFIIYNFLYKEEKDITLCDLFALILCGMAGPIFLLVFIGVLISLKSEIVLIKGKSNGK